MNLSSICCLIDSLYPIDCEIRIKLNADTKFVLRGGEKNAIFWQ